MEDVTLSRTLSRRTGVALGLSVAVAYAVFVVGPQLRSQLGEDTSGVFLTSLFLLLPLLLSLAELADRMRADASLYQLARTSGSQRVVFGVGWLCLGGYLVLASLFVQELVDQFSMVAEKVFGLALDPLPLGVFVVGVAALHELVGGARGAWRTRTLLVLSSVGALLTLLVIAASKADRAVDLVPDRSDLQPWLAGVALVAGGLWAMDLILDHRGQLRQPRRSVPFVLLTTWIVGNLLGGFAMWITLRHPDLLADLRGGELSFREHRLTLLVVTAAILLCGGGLLRMLSVFQRLLRSLQIDGFLPARTESARDGRSGLKMTFLLSSGVILGLAHRAAPLEMMAFVSLSALLAAVLVLAPFVLGRQEDPTGGLRLPWHPLLPALDTLSALYLAFRLLAQAGPALLGWAAFGLLWLLTYGRRANWAARERDLVLRTESAGGRDRARPVVVAVGGGSRSLSLVRAGAAIARAKGLELQVLKVVPYREQIPLEDLQRGAAGVLREVESWVDGTALDGVAARSLVRIAPSPEEGILATIQEQQADFLLMGWSSARAEAGEEIVEKVFPATARALGTIHGDLASYDKVVVATAGGAHAVAAAELGRALAGDSHDFELVTVEMPRQVGDGGEVLRDTAAGAGLAGDVTQRVLKGPDVGEALLGAVGGQDLLVLGASTDRLLNLNRLQGLGADLAEEREGPTLIVKRRETATLFWRRRLWEPIDRWLPTLSVRERAAVLAQMRHSAKANVDFNVMIFLASFIASLGLLLDSSAVIIGAMLVAPLMSPILALAQGIVQGNASMVRRAATSVAQGTLTSILIGTFFGLLLPAENLTNEMLARGQPNLLDLLVALAAGAAAAYAVSQSSVAAALPGVAISVALVPPLCVVGLGIGMAHFGLALGALLLYFTNFIGIVLIGTGVFLALGFRPTRAERDATVFRSLRWVVVAILLASIPLAFQTRTSLRSTRLEARLRQVLDRVDDQELKVITVNVGEGRGRPVVDIVVVGFGKPQDLGERAAKFREELEKAVGFPLVVRLSRLEAKSVESVEVSPEPAAD